MTDHRRWRWRAGVGEAVLAVFLSLAASEVPVWRWDPERRPVAVLAVGDPMTPLPVRARGELRSAT